MEIKTKFNMGDVLSSVGNKYIGRVISIKVAVEKVEETGVEAYMANRITYTLRGNERDYDLKEENLYCLEKAKKLEMVREQET